MQSWPWEGHKTCVFHGWPCHLLAKVIVKFHSWSSWSGVCAREGCLWEVAFGIGSLYFITDALLTSGVLQVGVLKTLAGLRGLCVPLMLL